MGIPGRVIKIIDRINLMAGMLASVGAALLVVLVTLDVILRYCFATSFVMDQELEWTIFSAMFLLGAGYTLKENSHVRVDVLYHRAGKRTKALINCLGTVFFLLPGCWLVIKTSIPFVKASWAMGETSPDPGGLRAYYLIKALIPMGFVLLSLQAIPFFIHNLNILLNKRLLNDEAEK